MLEDFGELELCTRPQAITSEAPSSSLHDLFVLLLPPTTIENTIGNGDMPRGIFVETYELSVRKRNFALPPG